MMEMRNRLAGEPGAWAAMNAGAPVFWQPWNAETLRHAAELDRPVLLFAGTATCHHSRIMARECFNDASIAAMVNEHFVPVLVDARLRPDLDLQYQRAIDLLGQPGGWPLTVFLTADGRPFWGGTRFSLRATSGRPAFGDILQGIAAAWADERDRVEGNVTALTTAIEQLGQQEAGGPLQAGRRDEAAAAILERLDNLWGGIGIEAKSYAPCQLEMLWRAWKRTGRTPFRTGARNSLLHIAQGGVYDHLGGGFHRPSGDREWLIPRFEKALDENAALIRLLTAQWQDSRERLWAARVHETIGWVLREMQAKGPDGETVPGFIIALSGTGADGDEGTAGKSYLWTESEIDRLLGQDSPLFKRAFDVSALGNWEHSNILNRRLAPDHGDEEEEAWLGGMRATLFHARTARTQPARHEVVLPDANAMMIAAICEAGLVFSQPAWIKAARAAFDFILSAMMDEGPADGLPRLARYWHAGRAGGDAVLGDYAWMARAGIALFEATGDSAPMDHAIRLVATVNRHFSHQDGGWTIAADTAGDVALRLRDARDDTVASGNAVMLDVISRLWHLTGHESWRARAEATICAFSGRSTMRDYEIAGLLNAAEGLSGMVQIVIAGKRGDPVTDRLVSVVRHTALPDRLLLVLEKGESLPPGHAVHEQISAHSFEPGRATAWVCHRGATLAPVTDAEELAALLAGLGAIGLPGEGDMLLEPSERIARK